MAVLVGSTFIDHEYNKPNLVLSCEAPSRHFVSIFTSKELL